MTSSVQLEMLDLRHFSARQLQPLLQEEGQLWRHRLLWDYEQSSRLLLEYVDSRILPGYAALDRGRIRGYCFAVYEANKAILGDVFASENSDPSARDVEEQLLAHMLPLLQNSPGIERVESQLLLHPSGLHTATFQNAGFIIYPRLFMLCDVEKLVEQTHAASLPQLPAEFELRHWLPTDLSLAGELIVRSYHGHADALINSQYLTMHGAMRFLHNIVQFPGCGAFDPTASWMLVDRATGRLAGLVLCSIVSPESAHITQICIAPELRRHGLAKILMAKCAAALDRRNLRSVTLTVTESNHGAVQLYEQLGFTTHHSFDAMVWSL